MWLGLKKGNFSVKSFYSYLASRRAEPFPHDIVWNFWVPVGVGFFPWEVIWVGILTLDQLGRRGWRIPNKCYMCKEDEETSDYILLHCIKARNLWQLVFALFGVQWVMHSSIRGFFLGWSGSFVGKKGKKAWKVSPLCVFWTIWRERNKRAINNWENLRANN